MTMASDFEVEHYLDHQAEIFLERFDPLTYLYLSRVMDYFDPFAETAVARRTRASCSSRSDSDWRFGTEHSRDIVRELRGARRRRPPRGDRLAVGPRLVPDGRAGLPGARRGLPGVGSAHARGGAVDGRSGRDHRPDAAARRGAGAAADDAGGGGRRDPAARGARRAGDRDLRRVRRGARRERRPPRGGRRHDPRRAADRGQPRAGRSTACSPPPTRRPRRWRSSRRTSRRAG